MGKSVLSAMCGICLLAVIGCEEAQKPTPSAATERARLTPLIFNTADLARGTMNGLQPSDDGSLVLRRKNILRNSSFEWDDYENRGIRDGLAADWGLWGKGYGTYSDSSVPYLPNEATRGTRSQRVELTANGKEPLSLLQSVRGLKPNTPYTFSADVKIDDPESVETALKMQFFSNDKYVSGKEGAWSAPTTFTRLSLSAVTPPGVDQIRPTVLLRPKKPNAHATLWVDAAQLEQSEKATPYSAAYEPGPGEFISPPIDLNACGDAYKFTWIACQPPPSDLRFQIRTAAAEAELASAKWIGPPGADAYSTRIETGDNLVADPSVERDINLTGEPLSARTQGYGDNDRKLTVVSDAHEGKKALKVEITKYTNGDGRWHVPTRGKIEKDTEYAFSVWHKENSPNASIRLSVTLEDSKGQMNWGKGGSDAREASIGWRQDTLYFRTPKEMDIKRFWVQISLNGVGWIISDSYSVRRVVGAEEWAVNPDHRGAKWLQYRAVMSTADSYYTPRLYKVEFRCGRPVPEIRWLNILSDKGDFQKYSFNPGQTAVFKPQIIDFSGNSNIAEADLVLKDPSGVERLKARMTRPERTGDGEVFFTHRHQFPPDAPQGEWQATVTVRNKSGGACSETALLKVRPPYTAPPPRMVVGALVDDYGFARHTGEPLQKLIEKYRSCTGLEIWKLAVSWKRLEPTPDRFDDEVISGFKAFIAAAKAAGAKAQITIQQQAFPDWANNGEWDSRNRYRYDQTNRLTDTWSKLAAALKDCPGLESYLLINEENCVYDADVYLRAMTKVAAAVRLADPNLGHRITVRPNTRDTYLRTRIATDGSQDYDYGSGGYPTSSAWFFKKYASPVSQTSCMRMARFHESPVVFGGPGGIGEVGFFCRPPKDAFGDEERLLGFERAMKIAYEMGMDEYMLWGGGFSFDKLDVYFPKLLAFRDELVKRPRPSGFDVRLLLDTEDKLYVEKSPSGSELDMSVQPFAAAIRFLDEKGFVWYYAKPEAVAIQKVEPRATVKLSELKDKSADEQVKWLSEKLADVKPSGTPLPWPE